MTFNNSNSYSFIPIPLYASRNQLFHREKEAWPEHQIALILLTFIKSQQPCHCVTLAPNHYGDIHPEMSDIPMVEQLKREALLKMSI